MEDQRADPLLVAVRTGITVTPGKMVKWEYKLTDNLGDTGTHRSEQCCWTTTTTTTTTTRLDAECLCPLCVHMALSTTCVAGLYTFLLRACTWEKYSRDNERNVLESVTRLWRAETAVTINQITRRSKCTENRKISFCPEIKGPLFYSCIVWKLHWSSLPR